MLVVSEMNHKTAKNHTGIAQSVYRNHSVETIKTLKTVEYFNLTRD